MDSKHQFHEIFASQMMHQCVAGMKIIASHDYEGAQRWRLDHYFEWFEFELVIDFATPIGDSFENNVFLRLSFSKILFMQFIKAETDTTRYPNFFQRLTDYRYNHDESQAYAAPLFQRPSRSLRSENMSRIWKSNSTEFLQVQRQRAESRSDDKFDEKLAHYLIEIDEFFTIEILGELNAWTGEGDAPTNLQPIDDRNQG